MLSGPDAFLEFNNFISRSVSWTLVGDKETAFSAISGIYVEQLFLIAGMRCWRFFPMLQK